MQLYEKVFTEPLTKGQGWGLIDDQRVVEITAAYLGLCIHLKVVNPRTLFGTLLVTVVVIEFDPEKLRFFGERDII